MWAGGILILLLIAGLVYTTWELGNARKATIEADIAREKAIALAEETSRQTQIAIQEAESRTKAALELAATANRNAQSAIVAASRIRSSRATDVATIPSLTATVLTSRLQESATAAYGRQVSVGFDGNGFYADRAFMDSAAKSFIETLSLREENTELRTAVDEQSKQIAALLEVVDADKAKFVALDNRIRSLDEVTRADRAFVKALQTELKAEKRKNLWRRVWGGVAVAGGVGLGVLVGKSL